MTTPTSPLTPARGHPAIDPSDVPATGGRLAPLRYRLDEVDGRQILASDGPGGPRIVEAFGDVVLADHVAVLVPGNGHHLGNYLTESGPVGPRARGHRLLHSMRRLAPDVRSAVVVWVGYRAPASLAAAASIAPARESASDLAALTWFLPRSTHVTLVGHSYGTVVTGLALADARAEDCVALGSPGMGVWRRKELGTSTRLWAGSARTDWIRCFPRVRLGRLGLGRSPLYPGLGATRITTGDVAGHCGYYAEGSESFLNAARIAVGLRGDVTLASSTASAARLAPVPAEVAAA